MLDGLPMYKEILRLAGFSETLLPYVYEGDLEIKADYLEQLETLDLQQTPGGQYDDQSFEYRCLNLAFELYSADDADFDVEIFRDKIRIDGQYQIQEVALKDELYEGLKLSEVLPEAAQGQDIAAQITTQLMEFPNIEFISQVIFRPEARDKHEIFEAIRNQDDQLILNGAQLAFMILYKQEGGDFLFHEFNIVAMDERRYPAQYFYYTHPHRFVRNDATLSAPYQSVTKYLGIDALNPGYTINPSFVIGQSPYFEDGELVCPSLKEELTEADQQDFIEFLFDQWSKNETAHQVISQTVWSAINDTPIEQVLGFVPNLLVLQDAENIPTYLQHWLNAEEADKDAKTEILKDFGVNTGDSPAVRLRTFLADGGTWDLEESPMSDFEDVLLVGALEYMQRQQTVFADETRLQVLQDIYHQLDYDTYLGQVPMIYVHSFKDQYTNYILLPKAENDSYFNENTLNHLEGHDITLLQIFTILQKQGKPLMPMEVYPKKWGKKSAERIHLSSPKLDTNKLMSRAKEWEAKYYLNWRNATELDHRVFFYADTLPYSLFFQEEALYTEEREVDSITDDEHRLFISQKVSEESNQSVDELVKEFLPSSEYESFLEAKAKSSGTPVTPINVQSSIEEPEQNVKPKGISSKLAQFIIENNLTDDDIGALEEFLSKRKKW